MQTFLPYDDFRKSAEVLDRQRLGKQRAEVVQILNALQDEDNGWRSHPAVKMWAGYGDCLVRYGVEVCEEWQRRGYNDNTMEKIKGYAYDHVARPEGPPWLGNRDFHLSHRSNLVRKDAAHYRQCFPFIADDIDYVWPDSDREFGDTSLF